MSTTPACKRSERFATIAILALGVVAIPVYLILGSEAWFRGDDWTFLSGRSVTTEGLLANHSGHWVTLPFFAFRVLYALFGLHTYAPYQLLAIVSHVSLVVLGYLVMRRMRVQPWLATAFATVLLFFGAGAFNIFIAFQITLNGSICCGLAFLLLVDHEGDPDYRNVAGVIVAIVGLMTSAAMVPMIIGVFTALVLRRGLVSAVSHVALPAVLFVLWYLSYGTTQSEKRGTPGQTLELFLRMTTDALEALGQSPLLGGILGAVIVFGLGCACREAVRERNGATLALPAALVVAWLSFCAAASLRAGNLSFSSDLSSSSRYLHIGAVLLLPLIALGGYYLTRVRWQLALVPVVTLALGLPANLDALVNYVFVKPNREFVLAVAHSDLLDQAPGDYRPLVLIYNYTTVDWLRSALAKGEVPPFEPSDVKAQLFGDAFLALSQSRAVTTSCVPRPGRLALTAHAGDIINFKGQIVVFLINGPVKSTPFTFLAQRGPLVIRSGPVSLEIAGIDDTEPVVCMEAG